MGWNEVGGNLPFATALLPLKNCAQDINMWKFGTWNHFLQSSITREILAYLVASLLERSADHLCCKCLIGKKQVMLNKITAYHQLGKMVIIELEWMWSEYCSREWSIMRELWTLLSWICRCSILPSFICVLDFSL